MGNTVTANAKSSEVEEGGMTFTPFAPGNKLGGRTPGAKNKLHRSFIEALTKDFEENGDKAIRQLRVTAPGKYLQIIANTLPREFFFTYDTVAELSDDEMRRLIETLRAEALRVTAQAPLMLTVEKVSNAAE
jgi:hypothetical protein